MNYYTEKEKEQLCKEMLEIMYHPLVSFSELHNDFLEKNNLENLKCFSVNISSNSEDLAIVKNKKTNMQGVYLYSEHGYTLCIPLEFDNIDFGFSCFVVKSKNLYGLYSFSGECILPIEYDNILTPYNRRAIIEKSGLKGLFSIKLNDWILPLEYDDISILAEDSDLAIVKKSGLVGLYSLDLHDWILPLEYTGIYTDKFYNSHNTKVLKVEKGYRLGVYSVSLSKFIIPILYNTVRFYSNCISTETCDSGERKEARYDYNGKFLSSSSRLQETNYTKGDIRDALILFGYCGW